VCVTGEGAIQGGGFHSRSVRYFLNLPILAFKGNWGWDFGYLTKRQNVVHIFLEALPLCFKKNTSIVPLPVRPKLQWVPGLLSLTDRQKDRQTSQPVAYIAPFAYIGGQKQKRC